MLFRSHQALDFELPGTLKVILFPAAWEVVKEKQNYYPLFSGKGFTEAKEKHGSLNFVMLDCYNDDTTLNDHSFLDELANDPTVVLCLNSTNTNAMQSVRRMFITLMEKEIRNPVILMTDSQSASPDEHLIHFATETGALLLDGMGDGICLGYRSGAQLETIKAKGRTYLPVNNIYQFTNNTAFSILQATQIGRAHV